MKFTSVTGHLMNHDFKTKTKWELNKIEDMYDMDIEKFIKNDSLQIVSNLDQLAT